MVDEVGYQPLERVISKRYEKDSIILTSNKTFSERRQAFGDEVLATAILDRLLHHCDVISINGPSSGSRTGSPPSIGTPKWPDQREQRRPSPDNRNLRKRLLPFTQLGNEYPAGQPPGLAPPLIYGQRVPRPSTSVLRAAHLTENGVDLPQGRQNTATELPFTHQGFSHAKSVIEVQGDLIRHQVVLGQPGNLGRGISGQHGQRLKQQAPTERTRILHTTIVARVHLPEPTNEHLAEHIHPYFVEHVHKYADTTARDPSPQVPAVLIRAHGVLWVEMSQGGKGRHRLGKRRSSCQGHGAAAGLPCRGCRGGVGKDRAGGIVRCGQAQSVPGGGVCSWLHRVPGRMSPRSAMGRL